MTSKSLVNLSDTVDNWGVIWNDEYNREVKRFLRDGTTSWLGPRWLYDHKTRQWVKVSLTNVAGLKKVTWTTDDGKTVTTQSKALRLHDAFDFKGWPSWSHWPLSHRWNWWNWDSLDDLTHPHTWIEKKWKDGEKTVVTHTYSPWSSTLESPYVVRRASATKSVTYK